MTKALTACGRRLRQPVAAAILALSTYACGQTGPLFLPEEAAGDAGQPAGEVAPAADSAAGDASNAGARDTPAEADPVGSPAPNDAREPADDDSTDAER